MVLPLSTVFPSFTEAAMLEVPHPLQIEDSVTGGMPVLTEQTIGY